MKVQEKKIISNPSDTVPEIRYFGRRTVEHFGLICLDGGHHIVGKTTLFKGGYSSTTVDVRVLLYYAIKHRACAVIIWHNHPSGETSPSKLDIETTNKVKQAFEICGMQLLDHIIIGRDDYFSFVEHNAI